MDSWTVPVVSWFNLGQDLGLNPDLLNSTWTSGVGFYCRANKIHLGCVTQVSNGKTACLIWDWSGLHQLFLASVSWIIRISEIKRSRLQHFHMMETGWMRNPVILHPEGLGAFKYATGNMNLSEGFFSPEYRFNKVSLGLRPNPWTRLSYDRSWNSLFCRE